MGRGRRSPTGNAERGITLWAVSLLRKHISLASFFPGVAARPPKGEGLYICSSIPPVKANFSLQLNGLGLTCVMIPNHEHYFQGRETCSSCCDRSHFSHNDGKLPFLILRFLTPPNPQTICGNRNSGPLSPPFPLQLRSAVGASTPPLSRTQSGGGEGVVLGIDGWVSAGHLAFRSLPPTCDAQSPTTKAGTWKGPGRLMRFQRPVCQMGTQRGQKGEGRGCLKISRLGFRGRLSFLRNHSWSLPVVERETWLVPLLANLKTMGEAKLSEVKLMRAGAEEIVEAQRG